MILKIAFGLVLVSIAAAPHPAAPQFTVGGITLEMPMPDGYCLPSGQDAVTAQLLAAGDSNNVTDLSLSRCDGKAEPDADYTLIKTPKTALIATVERQALLDSVGAEFDNSDFREAVEQSNGEVEKDLSKVIGQKINMKGSVDPLGRDDVCAYMGGILSFKSGEISYDQSVGACITVVGNRVITLYRYDRSNTAEGVANLLLEAKALALTVSKVGVKTP